MLIMKWSGPLTTFHISWMDNQKSANVTQLPVTEPRQAVEHN